MLPTEETPTSFLTVLFRWLSTLFGVFVLLLLGSGFAGGEDDDDEQEGDAMGPYYNHVAGEWDDRGDPYGLYK